jgi:hypothetical protein
LSAVELEPLALERVIRGPCCDILHGHCVYQISTRLYHSIAATNKGICSYVLVLVHIF